MQGLQLDYSSRRRRRISPLALAALALAVAGGIALLWYWVFAPIFISPQEFFARQKRFDRAIREVLAFSADGPEDTLPAWPPPLSRDRISTLLCAERAFIRGVRYAPQARNIAYPFGDIPEHLGTSADLVVRCLRAAGIDLQQLVHHDRKLEPRRYPLSLYRNKKVDRNLDHRRASFLFAFSRAFMPAAPIETETPEAAALFIPGDLVFWTKDGRDGHPGLIGIVSDRRDESGMPLVYTLVSEDERMTHHRRLDEWPILGHFSLDIEALVEAFLETHPTATFELPPEPGAP